MFDVWCLVFGVWGGGGGVTDRDCDDGRHAVEVIRVVAELLDLRSEGEMV